MDFIFLRGDTMDFNSYVEQVATIPTVAMLKSYQTRGWLSRTFMLSDHGTMLNEVQQSQGKYATYSAADKDFVEVQFYLELFERLCQAIEDFTSIVHGLMGEFRDFPKNVLHAPSPQTVLTRMNRSIWNQLLQYAAVDALPLDQGEKQVLTEVRDANIDVLMNFVNILMEFIGKFWVIFNKLKHTKIAVVSGFQSIDFEGVRTYLIPAIYNRTQIDVVKGLFVNRPIYEKWKAMFDAVVTLTKELVDRALLVIETNGTLVSEYATFRFMDAAQRQKVEQIINKCNRDVDRTSLTVQVKSTVPVDDVLKQMQFYEFDLGAFPT